MEPSTGSAGADAEPLRIPVTEDDSTSRIYKEMLAQQNAELSRKNAALLEELSLVHENASLAQENARLAEQNVLLKMGNAANAAAPFPYGGMPPGMPPGILPAVPPPMLPLGMPPPGMHAMPTPYGMPPPFGPGYPTPNPHGSSSSYRQKGGSSMKSSGVGPRISHRGSNMTARSSVSSVASTTRSSVVSRSSIASSIGSNYLDEAAKKSYDGPPTTVMMKNVPSDYTREQLLEIVDAAGFKTAYDVVSLPIDLKDEVGLGYAFVNFVTHEQAEKFKEHFDGFKDWQVPCDKICEVLWSENLQGYDAHVERYRNSPVMHESVADKFKPALYKDGVRIDFPEPTKTIRAPRARRRDRGGGSKAVTQQNTEKTVKDAAEEDGTADPDGEDGED